MKLIAIDHVQLAMPEGGEESARVFYRQLLGLREVPKPPELAIRGGVWFENDCVKVHLGLERDFRPARKAHPAFVVQELNVLIELLKQHDLDVAMAEQIDGCERAHVHDPFGNRIELISAVS
jgi:catechol 2,3-dioxygenase-like lactoylglutathione lyase family enzyme